MTNLLKLFVMENNNPLNFLGLALRAGKIVDGESRVLQSIKNHPKGILFLANDTGENIRKKIFDKASFYNLKVITNYDSDTLSKALGKINRKVVLLTDQNFMK